MIIVTFVSLSKNSMVIVNSVYFEITADVGKGSRFESTKVRLTCDK